MCFINGSFTTIVIENISTFHFSKDVFAVPLILNIFYLAFQHNIEVTNFIAS
jgi:hypothetical protein